MTTLSQQAECMAMLCKTENCWAWFLIFAIKNHLRLLFDAAVAPLAVASEDLINEITKLSRVADLSYGSQCWRCSLGCWWWRPGVRAGTECSWWCNWNIENLNENVLNFISRSRKHIFCLSVRHKVLFPHLSGSKSNPSIKNSLKLSVELSLKLKAYFIGQTGL